MLGEIVEVLAWLLTTVCVTEFIFPCLSMLFLCPVTKLKLPAVTVVCSLVGVAALWTPGEVVVDLLALLCETVEVCIPWV